MRVFEQLGNNRVIPVIVVEDADMRCRWPKLWSKVA